MDAALNRVKRTVRSEHYQIFLLHHVRHMSARDVAVLLGVSVAKVYVASHRVARLVRRELRTLEKAEPG